MVFVSKPFKIEFSSMDMLLVTMLLGIVIILTMVGFRLDNEKRWDECVYKNRTPVATS